MVIHRNSTRHHLAPSTRRGSARGLSAVDLLEMPLVARDGEVPVGAVRQTIQGLWVRKVGDREVAVVIARGHDHGVGVAFMDAGHQGLIGALAEVGRAVGAGQDRARLDVLLERLATRARAHLTHEGREMRAHAYPWAGAHTALHADLVEELDALRATNATAGTALTVAAVETVRDHLARHFQDADRRLGDWLVRAGAPVEAGGGSAPGGTRGTHTDHLDACGLGMAVMVAATHGDWTTCGRVLSDAGPERLREAVVFCAGYALSMAELLDGGDPGLSVRERLRASALRLAALP